LLRCRLSRQRSQGRWRMGPGPGLRGRAPGLPRDIHSRTCEAGEREGDGGHPPRSNSGGRGCLHPLRW